MGYMMRKLLDSHICITGPLWGEAAGKAASPHKEPVIQEFDNFFVVIGLSAQTANIVKSDNFFAMNLTDGREPVYENWWFNCYES